MRLVDEGKNTFFEPAEGCLGDGFLVLLGLEVAAGEERHEVLQLSTPELRGERDARHVGVVRIVNIVIDVPQPAHLWKELGSGEGLVPFLDQREKFRGYGGVAEIVNGLTEKVAAIGFVCRDLRHGEVGLRKLGASGVYADENLSDGFDVEVFGKLDHADMVVDDLGKLLQNPTYQPAVSLGVALGIVFGQLEDIGIRREDLSHVL